MKGTESLHFESGYCFKLAGRLGLKCFSLKLLYVVVPFLLPCC